MLRKVFLGFALVVFTCACVTLFVTRNTAATHTILTSSDLLPLIPTRAFYADPRSEFGFVASSDGAYTVSEKASLLGRSRVVREVATGKQIAEFPVGMSGIRWHPSEPKLRFVLDGHDWEADIFYPSPENWVRTSPVQLSGGWALNEFATRPDQSVLFWGRTNPSTPGHMWRVSQDGLDASKIAEGTAQTQYWVFDHKGEAPLRVDSRDAATQSLLKKEGKNWSQMLVLDLNDTFQPVGRIDQEGKFLLISSRGRDKAALVEFDIATTQETVIFENPDGDVARTTTLTYDGPPDIIRVGFDTQEHVALTERGRVFLDVLDEFPGPVTLGFTAATASGRYVAQAISAQSESWIYLLIDLEQGDYQILDEYHFRRFKEHLVDGRVIRFAARDGLEIPAVLTMPENVSGPIPFIVYVHGGPAGVTSSGYGHGTQFLVNRGYGVLSVNFRGSTGFGKAFQAKGFKEFGRAMQDDITDAANWLVAEGLADTDALAVMGTSYGGYSATLAMTRDAGLFDAAIVEFPMLDVEFQSKYHPGFWNDGIAGWWRYFGQIDNPEDLAMMREYSPINRVDDLHGPLLVLGGVRDQITAVQQVRDFEKAAQKAGKDAQFHYFSEAGHGVSHWRDHLRRARLLEDFLADHLGGRSGGFELIEMAPAFID